MRHLCQAYAPDVVTRTTARVSPLRNPDLGHSAPAFLTVAHFDVLRDEGVAYPESLQCAGVDVTLIEVPGALHGFASLMGLSEPRETIIQGSLWLASKLA